MKKILVSLGLILSIFITPFVQAQEPEVNMNIVTGGEKGTYYQFGLNISSLLLELVESNTTLTVHQSKGSIENIYAVYDRPNTQLGIVQSDALAFISRVSFDPTLKKIANKVKMVFPLYDEEIHMIVRGDSDIQSFNDLDQKRVAIGYEGSGTYLTCNLLLEITGIQPAEIVPLGTERALAFLKSGSLDAMFYVAGAPVKLLTELTPDDNIRIVPIQNEKILEIYPTSTIPGGTYSFQSDPMTTASIKAVLITYDFRRLNCENVGNVGLHIYENLEWLREHGHPKWNQVDLNYKLVGWEQYDCVKKKIDSIVRTMQLQEQMRQEQINPVLEAIKTMFKRN